MAPAMPTVSSLSSFATFSTIKILIIILIPLISISLIAICIFVYRRVKQRNITNQQSILSTPVTSTGPLFKTADIADTIPIPSPPIQDVFIPADVVQQVVGASEADITDQNEDSRIYSIYSHIDDISTPHSSISFEPVDIADSPPSPEDEFVDVDLGDPGVVDVQEIDITVQNTQSELVYVACIDLDNNNPLSSDFMDVADALPLLSPVIVPSDVVISDVGNTDITATNEEPALISVCYGNGNSMVHIPVSPEALESNKLASPSSTSSEDMFGPADDNVPYIIDMLETLTTVQNLRAYLDAIDDIDGSSVPSIHPEPVSHEIAFPSPSLPADSDVLLDVLVPVIVVTDLEPENKVTPVHERGADDLQETPALLSSKFISRFSLVASDNVTQNTSSDNDNSYEYTIDFGYSQEYVSPAPFQPTWLPFSIEEEDDEDLEYQYALAPSLLDDGDVELTALITPLPASPILPIPDSPSSEYSQESFDDVSDFFDLYLALGKGDLTEEIIEDSGVAFNDSVEMSRNDEAVVCLESIPVIDITQRTPSEDQYNCLPVPSLSMSTLPLNVKKKEISLTNVSAVVDLQSTKPLTIVEPSDSSTSIDSLLEELMVPMNLTLLKRSESVTPTTEKSLQFPRTKPLAIVRRSSSAQSSLGIVRKDKSVESTPKPLQSSSLEVAVGSTKPLNVRRLGLGLGVADVDVVSGTIPLNIVKRSGSSLKSLMSVAGRGKEEDTQSLRIAKRSGLSSRSLALIRESRAVDSVQGLDLDKVEAIAEATMVMNPMLKGLKIVNESGSELFAESGSSRISMNEPNELTPLGPAFILESSRTFSSRRFKPDPFDTPPLQPLSANWSNSYKDEQPHSMSSPNSPLFTHNVDDAAATIHPPTSSSSRASHSSLEPFRAGKSGGHPSIALDSTPGLLGYHGLVSSSTSSCSGAGQALGSPCSPPLRLPVGAEALCSLLTVELDIPSSTDSTPESGLGSLSSSYTVRPGRLSVASVVSPRPVDIERPSAPTPSRGRFTDSSSSPLLPAFDSMVWLGASAHNTSVSPSPTPFYIRNRSRTAGSASPNYSPYRPSAPTPDGARHGHRRFNSCDSLVSSYSFGLRGSCSFRSEFSQDVYLTPSGSPTSVRSPYSPPARPSAPTPSRMRLSCSSSCSSPRSTRSPPARPCPPTPSRMRSPRSNSSSSSRFSAHRRRRSAALTFASFRLPVSQTTNELWSPISLIGSRPSRGYLHMKTPDVLSSSLFPCDSEPVIRGPRGIRRTRVSRAMIQLDNERGSSPSLDSPSLLPTITEPSSLHCNSSAFVSSNSPIHRLADELDAGWYCSPHVDTSSFCPTFGVNAVNMVLSQIQQSSAFANGSCSPSLATDHLCSAPSTPISDLMTEIVSSLFSDHNLARDPPESLSAMLPQMRSSAFTSRSLPYSPSRSVSNSPLGTPISRLISEIESSPSIVPSGPLRRPCAPTRDISDSPPRYLAALCGTPSPTTSPTVQFSPPDSRPTSFELRPESALSIDDELMFRYDAVRRPDKAYGIHVYQMVFLHERLAKDERVTPNYTASEALAVLEGCGHESKRIRGELRRTRLIQLEDARRAVRYQTRKLWEIGLMEGITDGFEEEEGEMAGFDEVEPDWEEVREYREQLGLTSSSESILEGGGNIRQLIDVPSEDDIDSDGFSMGRAAKTIMRAQPPNPAWLPPRDADPFIQDGKQRFWRRNVNLSSQDASVMVTHAFGQVPTMSLAI